MKSKYLMSCIEFEYTEQKRLIAKKQNFCDYFIQFEKQVTLRGGGCGSSIVRDNEPICFPNLPNNLATKLKEYTNTLVEKASLLMDENQKEEIMIAIQWFYFNQQHFNTLCYKFNDSQKIYSLLLESLDGLLKTAYIYLRGSGFLCIYILQICNDLMRVIFSFLMKDNANNKKYLEHTYKQQLQQYIASFESLLENESANVWVAGIEFELSVIRTALEHAPSNSTKKQELFSQFMNGMFKSIISMSLSDDLLETLIDIGTMIVTQIYNKHYKNRIRRYEIYYFFETLKWAVVNKLRNQCSVDKIMDQLVEGHGQYIKNSSDWLVHFCWIRMISDLATYRPIISKLENFKTEEEINEWNSLIMNKEIIVLSYSSVHARILFKENLKMNNQKKQKFSKENYFKLLFLKLMDQEVQNNNKIRLWKYYQNFSFKNLNKQLEEEISLNEYFFGSREIEIFRVQNNYLKELIVELTALDQQIQEQFKKFSKKQQDKTEKFEETYQNDIGSLLKQQKDQLIQILQLVFLIKFTNILFVKKIELILGDKVLKEKDQNINSDIDGSSTQRI